MISPHISALDEHYKLSAKDHSWRKSAGKTQAKHSLKGRTTSLKFFTLLGSRDSLRVFFSPKIPFRTLNQQHSCKHGGEVGIAILAIHCASERSFEDELRPQNISKWFLWHTVTIRPKFLFEWQNHLSQIRLCEKKTGWWWLMVLSAAKQSRKRRRQQPRSSYLRQKYHLHTRNHSYPAFLCPLARVGGHDNVHAEKKKENSAAPKNLSFAEQQQKNLPISASTTCSCHYILHMNSMTNLNDRKH